jgi:hypothetical protein
VNEFPASNGLAEGQGATGFGKGQFGGPGRGSQGSAGSVDALDEGLFVGSGCFDGTTKFFLTTLHGGEFGVRGGDCGCLGGEGSLELPSLFRGVWEGPGVVESIDFGA